TDRGRKAQLMFHMTAIPERWRREDIFYHLLGHHVGRIAGRRIPLIEGLPKDASRANLKALSAAVAASGGVELWHATGITPEAPLTETVLSASDTHDVTMADLARARDELSTARDGPLDMVALGTPHFSLAEFETLVTLLDGRSVARSRSVDRCGMIQGRVLNPGTASGAAFLLTEALSFWGGFDPKTGDIIDIHHPQRGANLARRIVLIAETRGSGTSSGTI